jgi:hypothetical protein
MSPGQTPEALTEAQRLEVLQPFALPDPLFQVLPAQFRCTAAEGVAEHGRHPCPVGVPLEQCGQIDFGPQRCFTDAGFENRRVAVVAQRDRKRAGGQQRVLEQLDAISGGDQAQLQPPHGTLRSGASFRGSEC